MPYICGLKMSQLSKINKRHANTIFKVVAKSTQGNVVMCMHSFTKCLEKTKKAIALFKTLVLIKV